LAPVVGTCQQPARAAILFDWESWWAAEADSHPTSRLRYRQEALDWYSAFLALGVRADVVPVRATLDGYDLVVAPVLHMVPAALGAGLGRYVAGGGHLVATYFSGIVDENDHIWPGGYPGVLRDLLGIRVEEFGPLLDGERVDLDIAATGSLWTDRIDLVDPATEVLARYTSGDQAGRPAVTRRQVSGGGSAGYVSTRLGPTGLQVVLEQFLTAAGVPGELPAAVRGLVQLVVRRAAEAEFWFLVNRTGQRIDVPDVDGELLVGSRTDAPSGPVVLGPREVAVLRRAA
jgi:beta-galactosidase